MGIKLYLVDQGLYIMSLIFPASLKHFVDVIIWSWSKMSSITVIWRNLSLCAFLVRRRTL